MMAGEEYTGCCAFRPGGWALFELGGRYGALSFKVGHIDGKSMDDGTLNIFLDGELARSLDLAPEAAPEEVTVALGGAREMKIELNTGWGRSEYALADINIE